MSYLSSTKSKRRHTGKKPIGFIVFLVVLLGLSLFSPLKSVFESLAYKTQGARVVYSFFSWFHLKSTLLEDREALKDAIAKNTVLEDEIEILKEENEILRGLKEPKDGQLISEVLLHPGFSPYDVLVLKAGEQEGVSLGDLVFYQSLLVGEISEVSLHTSKATLLSSGDKTFPVRLGVHDAEFEARGLGNGTFEVIVPKTISIQVGDKAKSNNMAGSYVGVVLDVTSEESNAFQKVLFSFPVNINHIRFVTIQKSNE